MIAEENAQHHQRSDEVPAEDRPWAERVEHPGTQDRHRQEGGHFEAAEEHEHAEQHVSVTLGESEQARGRHPERPEPGP